MTDDPAPSESLTAWRVRDGKLEPLSVELVKISPETNIMPRAPDLYLIEVPELEVGDRLRFEAKQHGRHVDRPALQVEVIVAPPVDEQAGPWTLHARRKLL